MKIRATALALLSVPVSSMAVDYFWNVGSGDWATAGNWNPAGPPGGGAGNAAFINNAGTATLSAGSNPIQDALVGSGAGTSGTLNHTAGILNATAGSTFIGRDGGNGTYNMSGSSSLTTVELQVGGKRDAATGSQAGTTGNFTMNTTGSVTATGSFWVGSRGGTGTATINGGTLTAPNIRIADNEGSVSAGSGTLTINGGTITSAGQFQTGRHGGVGIVNQTGGTVNVNGGWFGVANDNAGSAGSKYSISGGALNLNNAVNAEIGADTQGTFEVSGTAAVNTNAFFVGLRPGGNGTFNMSGGTLMSRAGDSRIGDAANTTGVWNLSGGAVTMNSFLQVGATGTGTLNMTGGTITNTGWLVVGRFAGGNGTANVSAGQVLHNVSGTSMIIGEQGTGTLTVSGTGLVRVNSTLGLRIGHTATGNGTINLNGGVLETHFIQKSDAASVAKINFNGGTVRSLAGSGDFFLGMTPANLEVKAGGLVFDTNSFDVTVTQALNGAGGLTKLGGGTLTLNGVSTYAGQTTITTGTLKLGATGSLNPSSVVSVAAGATFDGSAVAGGIIVPLTQTLKGNGSVTGNVTVAGTVAPGNSIGTLSVTGTVTLAGTSNFELDASGPAADLLSATGAITYGGSLSLTNLGGTLANGQTYNLFDAPSFGSAFGTINWPAGTTAANWVNNLGVNGTITYIPEPGSAGLLALALAGLARRRRRA